MKFQQAVVIGTGMMGPGIALTLALGGLKVAIASRNAEGAARGIDTARRQMEVLRSNGLVTDEVAADGLARITAGMDLDALVRNADLVIESAPENMAFKQELFARLDALTRPDCVLASNTSGLSITDVASRCARPERVLTAHFWNPPHLMPLVELVKGERTSDVVVEAVRQLLLLCGKVPVVVKKDRPGQLGNRLQMALVREAAYIVQEGIASVEDVDRAAKMGFGLRLPVYGIFEHQDAVGLDMGLHILDYVAQDLYNEPRAPREYRGHVERGETGAKSGRGFYDWSRKSLDEVKALRDRFVLDVVRNYKLPPD